MLEKKLGVYMRKKRCNLSEVCRGCGLNYHSIYKSLYSDRTRELRAVEFLKLCTYIRIDPAEFYGREVMHNGGKEIA